MKNRKRGNGKDKSMAKKGYRQVALPISGPHPPVKSANSSAQIYTCTHNLSLSLPQIHHVEAYPPQFTDAVGAHGDSVYVSFAVHAMRLGGALWWQPMIVFTPWDQ
jgi:hypothetical protein